MSNGFIQYQRNSERSKWLRRQYPNAFLLLSLIAERARRTKEIDDGMPIGGADVGDFQEAGLTRQEYRTAVLVLEKYKYIEIISTQKAHQKSTTKATTERTTNGTRVKLIDNTVWDINSENENINKTTKSTTKSTTSSTTEQPPSNHEQEVKKVNKEVKNIQIGDSDNTPPIDTPLSPVRENSPSGSPVSLEENPLGTNIFEKFKIIEEVLASDRVKNFKTMDNKKPERHTMERWAATLGKNLYALFDWYEFRCEKAKIEGNILGESYIESGIKHSHWKQWKERKFMKDIEEKNKNTKAI